MNVFTITAAILTLACLVFAAFLYKKLDRKKYGNWLLLHSVAVSIWVGANAMADTATVDSSLVFWSGLALAGGVFTVSFYLCFAESYVLKGHPNKVSLFIFLLPAFLISMGAWTSLSVASTYYPDQEPSQIIPGPLYIVATLFIFAVLLYASVRFLVYARTATATERLQIIYVELGTAILFTGAAFFGFFLPYFGEYRFFNLGPQFSFFLLAFSTYAIVKHRLMDIKVIIQRGIIYSVLLVIVGVVYVVLLLVIQILFEWYAGASYVVASLLTTVIGIFGAPPLNRLFERLTDHIFFKNRCSYEDAVDKLSSTLNQHLDLDELVTKVSADLDEIFRSDWVRFVLSVEKNGEVISGSEMSELQKCDCGVFDGTGTCLDKVPERLRNFAIEMRAWCQSEGQHAVSDLVRDAAMLVPIVHEKRLVAMLGLGPKRSGDLYCSRDEKILTVFSQQCAVAIVKASLYEQVKDRSWRLAEEVRERTSELERSYQERSDMMIDIAHNLQTPLTILKSQLESAQHQAVDKSMFAKLALSIDKISEFARRLLKFASLTDRSKLAQHVVDVDLSELLRGIISYFEVLASEQNIKLRMDIGEAIVVRGNREQFEELILNILSNAAKFIDNEREISVELKQAGQMVKLLVKDTGRGIPESDQNKLFSRFHRSADSKELGGSGLGLAICKRIVELHDGSINIESRVGIGTTVTVYLPIHQSDS